MTPPASQRPRPHGARAAGSLRRLASPVGAGVVTDDGGLPRSVDGRAVEALRERWIVEEGWWSEHPVRRSYAEVVLENGALAIVFRDLRDGSWWRQPPG